MFNNDSLTHCLLQLKFCVEYLGSGGVSNYSHHWTVNQVKNSPPFLDSINQQQIINNTCLYYVCIVMADGDVNALKIN